MPAAGGDRSQQAAASSLKPAAQRYVGGQEQIARDCRGEDVGAQPARTGEQAGLADRDERADQIQ